MNTNGTIQFITQTASGVDPETGDPIASTKIVGEPIDCHIKTLNQSNKGRYESGTFTQASYEILIENQTTDGSRVKLNNSSGVEIGEFTIQSKETLGIVNRIKITV